MRGDGLAEGGGEAIPGAARRARRKAKLTPMLAQYLRVKEQVGDAILFFRLGDFYEMFFEDAERAAPLLELTLTSRNKDDPSPIPMCGVPHHAARGYIGRLVAQGLRVAICDQVGESAEGSGSGLIERRLVRVITPGTVLDEDEGLAQGDPGYLVGVARGEGGVGIAAVEASTGEVRCCRASSAAAAREELERIGPREIVLPADADEELRDLVAELAVAQATARSPEGGEVEETAERLAPAPAPPALRAALVQVLAYLGETLRGGLGHLRPAYLYELGDHLRLDERSRRNLAVLEGAGGGRFGSLWWALDETVTAMGSRRLRDWLVYPLLDLRRISERQEAVAALVEAPGLRAELADRLRRIGDLERLVGRICVGRAGPREIVRLGHALGEAAALVSLLDGVAEAAGRLGEIAAAARPPVGLAERILGRLAEPAPASAGEGGVVREGSDPEVDRLRELLRDAQRLIAALEAREREGTGIGSLKIRYHRVLGYFFEVTKANLARVPPHFVRRQSMASGERFSTPELVELERQLATADERCRERERALFEELLGEISARETELARVARALADLDALLGLAAVAHDRGYVRPRLHRGRHLRIRDGRHPVVERTSAAGSFVPNDAELDDGREQIVILTGPNMAGKSTYLRQVALIVLLAHAGSFVPAAEAEIPLTDRIWTRVGAADDLVAGDSTFMVEMKETAAILGQLTPRTLVVLDEIGRGTSTYDGIAIAWAVAEYLHDFEPAPGARVKTLFATHFHELTALAESRPRIANRSVAVREWRDEVMFLRRVVPGPASRSYGVAVARLAGVPEAVVSRARELLHALERGAHGAAGGREQRSREEAGQLELFPSRRPPEWTQELAALEIERMTPLDALKVLDDFVRRARREREP